MSTAESSAVKIVSLTDNSKYSLPSQIVYLPDDASGGAKLVCNPNVHDVTTVSTIPSPNDLSFKSYDKKASVYGDCEAGI